MLPYGGGKGEVRRSRSFTTLGSWIAHKAPKLVGTIAGGKNGPMGTDESPHFQNPIGKPSPTPKNNWPRILLSPIMLKGLTILTPKTSYFTGKPPKGSLNGPDRASRVTNGFTSHAGEHSQKSVSSPFGSVSGQFPPMANRELISNRNLSAGTVFKYCGPPNGVYPNLLDHTRNPVPISHQGANSRGHPGALPELTPTLHQLFHRINLPAHTTKTALPYRTITNSYYPTVTVSLPLVASHPHPKHASPSYTPPQITLL